jgi:hypothetical protein
MNVFALMTRGVIEPEHVWLLSGINMKLALTVRIRYTLKDIVVTAYSK